MKIIQTNSFGKEVKKLHKNQKQDLDRAILELIAAPYSGTSKKGDLEGIRVYKFFMVNQMIMIAYEFNDHENEIALVALGSHENFYRNLKKI